MENSERKKMMQKEFAARYQTQPALFVQAPGRVDLMGSHTDYNLGYVLTQAIDRNTWIAAKARTDKKVRISSLNIDGNIEFSLDKIVFDPEVSWGNYIRGVADIFQKEGYQVNGFDALIHSTIPFGSGLSSSAAVEVATAVLLEELSDWQIDPVQRAIFCQRAENEFVGMSCGILDQYSSVMGKQDSVLLLDCRSITSKTRPIAPGVQVMICDTKAKRALTGSEYPERRAQCTEGARILGAFYPEIESLRDAKLEQVQEHEKDMEPVVYKRSHFIVEENQRVLDIASALEAGEHAQAGKLACTSFAGARDLFEIVSNEMSEMYDAIMNSPGVFGTRGAGAGFGGCMVAFVEENSIMQFAEEVYNQYLASTGIQPEIYPVQATDGAGKL